MNPSPDDAPVWPILFLIGIPLFLVAVWSGIGLILSALSGWWSLAKKYPATAPPTGTCFRRLTGSLQGIRYGFALNVHAAPDGLHLAVSKLYRLGNPPMFIPWTAVHHATTEKFLWMESVFFEIGSPKDAKMWLPKKVFTGAPIVLDGQRGLATPPPLPGARVIDQR